ncbi:MAG: TetR/AcrR family transcriptional regulator [Peptococcaceae bacterium]|nr:TetR/AcrR family transcriptional regulator [Peptococcaceae bacterium]MBP3625873.1 TetR/AcrR family transcriptional regulator [Peptococcaceae bacterium]
MGKQTEKTLQTKTDLIEAFWQLYKEMPINKITVKDITNRAGYYRSTFYNYFDDVYAVLNDIEASVLQDWEDILSTAFHEKYKVLIYKDIQIIINLIIPFYEKNGEYIAVLLSPNGDPTFQKKIKSTLRQKLFVLLEIPPHTLEAELMFECISSGILGLFVKWYNDKLPPSMVETIIQKMLDKDILSLMLCYSGNPLLKQFTP